MYIIIMASTDGPPALNDPDLRDLPTQYRAPVERIVDRYESQISSLKSQLDWFQRQLFGQTSERLRIEPDERQLGLPWGLPATDADALPPKQPVRAHERKPKRAPGEDGVGLRFDESVPVETIEIVPPELNGKTADQYEVIGTKETHRLARKPGRYIVLRYVRTVIKRKSDQTIVTPPAPDSVLERSMADVSFLAGMLLDKFAYHLPLYRQHQMLHDGGITLSRGALTQQAHQCISLLEPIDDAQRRSVLRSRVLAIDETPIKAGREKKGKLHRGYYWPMYGDRDEVVFGYRHSRAGKHLKELIGEYSGTLITDGYSAYDRYAKTIGTFTHALCWAHTRRGFERAQTAEPKLAEWALRLIAELYEHERIIREGELSGEAKLAHRARYSRPLVDLFFAWCGEQSLNPDLYPQNPLAKAVAYALEREAGLRIFLGDPEVPIDTNHLERALRPIPMGRKNWLFNWTEVGAQYVGVIQGLIVTCRLHDINPYTYLVDVLQRISSHPASKVDELTPRLWKEKFANQPLRSCVFRCKPGKHSTGNRSGIPVQIGQGFRLKTGKRRESVALVI